MHKWVSYSSIRLRDCYLDVFEYKDYCGENWVDSDFDWFYDWLLDRLEGDDG